MFCIGLDYNGVFNLEEALSFNRYLSGNVRSVRLGITVLRMIAEYKINGINGDSHQKSADMLLHTVQLNKGTYVKIGQHVSAMQFLLPDEYVSTLSVLQSSAPESPLEDVYSVIREDFGKEPNEIFDNFSEKIEGCASLAQVHSAYLKESGKKVAVKVQHKRVLETAHRDVYMMELGVDIASIIFPEFKLKWLVKVTKDNLFKELDFRVEDKNTKKAQQLYNYPWLIIPDCYSKYTSKRVIVMDFVEGCHVGDIVEKIPGIDPNKIIQRLQTLYSDMIFKEGFVHCDPHPGNVLVQNNKDNTIVLIDHGLYQIFSEELRNNYANLWYNIIQGNSKNIEKYAKTFNVKNFMVFTAMLTTKNYQKVTGDKVLSTKQKKMTAEEELKELQGNVTGYIYDITEVLEECSPELILIFKTNDLMRNLEWKFECRADCDTYLRMSVECLKALRKYNLSTIKNGLFDAVEALKNLIRQEFTLFLLFCYKLSLK